MRLQKYLIGLLAVASLAGVGNAQAALSFYTSGDLMIVFGKAEKGDVDKFKEALKPSIKTLVVRSPTGMNYDITVELAQVVEKTEPLS